MADFFETINIAILQRQIILHNYYYKYKRIVYIWNDYNNY